jgi:hypothetical protein
MKLEMLIFPVKRAADALDNANALRAAAWEPG